MAPNVQSQRTSSSSSSSRRRRSCSKNTSISAYIPPYLRQLVLPYHGDFCYSHYFHPHLLTQLMAEGFLPIATDGLVLPKLHEQRCVIALSALHVTKSVRKKARPFRLTINQDFESVTEGCRQQHGSQCWLHPPLVDAFRAMHANVQNSATIVTDTGPQRCPVRLVSVELWNKDNDLVAGELGYTVGSIYTSLTGFSRQDSAGSVQLAALGRLLQGRGFAVWDLGMEMDYKRGLGAQLMPRDEFVALVHSVRVQQGHLMLQCPTPVNARDLIDRTVQQDGSFGL